jgi:hypothetical protein
VGAALAAYQKTREDWASIVVRMGQLYIGFPGRSPATFHTWGDLLMIYGVDGTKIEAVQDKLSF